MINLPILSYFAGIASKDASFSQWKASVVTTGNFHKGKLVTQLKLKLSKVAINF